VRHLTQLEVYVNALAELEYLSSLPVASGGIRPGQEFYIGYDLRPSSTRRVVEQGGRGEIAQAIERAIRDAGLRPVNLGALPAPALAYHAWLRQRGGMMITGSHIPFDRNGYKTNSARGELLKEDETPIARLVAEVRARLMSQPHDRSLFDASGMFKTGPVALSPEASEGRVGYVRRYTDFFPGQPLTGMRLLVYQHSAVGRDLLLDLVRELGAEAFPAGRSETFVPIDTEAVNAQQLQVIEALAHEAWQRHGPLDAVISTDGDSDRPLLLGVLPPTAGGSGPPRSQVRFFGGDLVGLVVAEFLGADAVVVPISCNDAIDRGPRRERVEPKTRIGSPYVIAGMEKAQRRGRRVICGWEANGGFLVGSDIEWGGRRLTALPTRDAVLPILGVLLRMAATRSPMTAVFDRLPQRFSRAALLRQFPRPVSQAIVRHFTPSASEIADVQFAGQEVRVTDAEGHAIVAADTHRHSLVALRRELAEYFGPTAGFDEVTRLNFLDGVRLWFRNGDIAHLRPSGNADELRIYAVADSQERADAICAAGVAEPDGILRRLERGVRSAS
jgi:phosphomannomutase